MKKYYLVIILFAFALKNFAQTDIGLNFSKSLWQSNLVNPAFMPKNKVVIALPSISAGLYNTFGGVTTKNGTLTISNAHTNDRIDTKADISLGGLGFGVGKKGYLSFSHALHNDFFIGGSGDLFKIVTEGNAQFAGKTAALSPELSYSTYNEWAVAYAHNIGKLTVGAKAKLYNGLAAIKSGSNHTLDFTTNNDAYQLNFNVDYSLLASGNVAKVLGDFNTTPDFNTLKPRLHDGKGFGLDFGATYDWSEKLSFGASVTNLGKINWTNGQAYSSKQKFDIDGVDISNIIKDSSLTVHAPTLDTLLDKISFQKTATSFKTSPLTALNFSGSYQINSFLTANAAVSLTSRSKYMALNATAHWKNWIETGLTYSVRNNSFNDIGANVALKLGPLQVYVLTDNIIAAFKPFNNYNFNVRTGVNFAFGTTKRYKKVEVVEEAKSL